MCAPEGVLTWRIINSFRQLALPWLGKFKFVLDASTLEGQGGVESFSMGDHFEKGQHALLNEGEENKKVRV